MNFEFMIDVKSQFVVFVDFFSAFLQFKRRKFIFKVKSRFQIYPTECRQSPEGLGSKEGFNSSCGLTIFATLSCLSDFRDQL